MRMAIPAYYLTQITCMASGSISNFFNQVYTNVIKVWQNILNNLNRFSKSINVAQQEVIKDCYSNLLNGDRDVNLLQIGGSVSQLL